MIHVWHLRVSPQADSTPTFPDDYDHVADVETDSITDAYARTKDDGWTTRADVHMLGGRTTCRATALGDVLVYRDQPYRVDPGGYRPGRWPLAAQPK